MYLLCPMSVGLFQNLKDNFPWQLGRVYLRRIHRFLQGFQKSAKDLKYIFLEILRVHPMDLFNQDNP